MVKQSIGCVILHDKDIVIHFYHIQVSTNLPFISLTKIPGLSMLPRIQHVTIIKHSRFNKI